MTEQLHGPDSVARFLDRMATEVCASIADPAGVAFLGIRSQGVDIAQRVLKRLREQRGWDPPLGSLDITLYRDDLRHAVSPPQVRGTHIDFPLDGLTVYLFDDVLYTGRTVRAALTALGDYGRCQAVRLAVLVDRGHRELPVQPDFVGVTVDTAYEDLVLVTLQEHGHDDGIVVERGKITATR